MQNTEDGIRALDSKNTIENASNGHGTSELILLLPGLLDKDPNAVEGITAWCAHHVKKWHWQGHSPGDSNDVVQDALLDLLKCRKKHPECPVEELASVLIRALDKHKKRQQRAQKTSPTTIEDHARALRTVKTHEEETIEAEEREEERARLRWNAIRLCETLFEALEIELSNLDDHKHDLLTRHYRLQAFYPPRAAETERSKEARRKALYRARKSLCERLEDSFRNDLETAEPRQRKILEAAIAVVAKESYLDVLKLYGPARSQEL